MMQQLALLAVGLIVPIKGIEEQWGRPLYIYV